MWTNIQNNDQADNAVWINPVYKSCFVEDIQNVSRSQKRATPVIHIECSYKSERCETFWRIELGSILL